MSEVQPPVVLPLAGAAQEAQRIVIVASTKSMGLAVILAVLFGPLGLLYSTVIGAVVMFVVNVLAAIFTLGFGLLLTWPTCGIWAAIATKAHNEKLLSGAR